jgi:hypothetical protein
MKTPVTPRKASKIRNAIIQPRIVLVTKALSRGRFAASRGFTVERGGEGSVSGRHASVLLTPGTTALQAGECSGCL